MRPDISNPKRLGRDMAFSRRKTSLTPASFRPLVPPLCVHVLRETLLILSEKIASNLVIVLLLFTIKFPYKARSDWLKQRTLSEIRERVNDIKLAFKFLLRNFDKFDPN